MKKSIIMITILGLSSQFYAKEMAEKTMTLSQMTFKEKSLLNRKSMFKNKQSAWQKHKKDLIKNFKENDDSEMHLGRKNYYGKIRQKERQKDFYTSLKRKDDEIQQKLSDIDKELRMIKKHFRISQSD